MSPSASSGGLYFSDNSAIQTAAGAFLCVRETITYFQLFYVYFLFKIQFSFNAFNFFLIIVY